jgi:hypothetical protein
MIVWGGRPRPPAFTTAFRLTNHQVRFPTASPQQFNYAIFLLAPLWLTIVLQGSAVGERRLSANHGPLQRLRANPKAAGGYRPRGRRVRLAPESRSSKLLGPVPIS